MAEYRVTTGMVNSYNKMSFLPFKDIFPFLHCTNLSRYNKKLFSVRPPPPPPGGAPHAGGGGEGNLKKYTKNYFLFSFFFFHPLSHQNQIFFSRRPPPPPPGGLWQHCRLVVTGNLQQMTKKLFVFGFVIKFVITRKDLFFVYLAYFYLVLRWYVMICPTPSLCFS